MKFGPEQWIGTLTMEVELGKANSTDSIIRKAMEWRRERIGEERKGGEWEEGNREGDDEGERGKDHQYHQQLWDVRKTPGYP